MVAEGHSEPCRFHPIFARIGFAYSPHTAKAKPARRLLRNNVRMLTSSLLQATRTGKKAPRPFLSTMTPVCHVVPRWWSPYGQSSIFKRYACLSRATALRRSPTSPCFLKEDGGMPVHREDVTWQSPLETRQIARLITLLSSSIYLHQFSVAGCIMAALSTNPTTTSNFILAQLNGDTRLAGTLLWYL